MNNKKMANQYVCQILVDIYRDMSILMTKTRLKDPSFVIRVPGCRRENWQHTWSDSGILYVRAWTNKLSKDDIIKNMLHIIVHTYNRQRGENDIAPSMNRYHLKSFQRGAETLGLETSYNKTLGYQLGAASEECYEECMGIVEKYYKTLKENLDLYTEQVKKSNSYVLYQCPVCKKKIKAMDNSYVTCGIDHVQFERI